MKLDSAIVITKGFCFVLIGAFTPWAAALAQWANSETWPSKIIWVGVILPASVLGGASQLQAFLSGSFTAYQQKRENGQPPNLPPETKPPDKV